MALALVVVQFKTPVALALVVVQFKTPVALVVLPLKTPVALASVVVQFKTPVAPPERLLPLAYLKDSSAAEAALDAVRAKMAARAAAKAAKKAEAKAEDLPPPTKPAKAATYAPDATGREVAVSRDEFANKLRRPDLNVDSPIADPNLLSSSPVPLQETPSGQPLDPDRGPPAQRPVRRTRSMGRGQPLDVGPEQSVAPGQPASRRQSASGEQPAAAEHSRTSGGQPAPIRRTRSKGRGQLLDVDPEQSLAPGQPVSRRQSVGLRGQSGEHSWTGSGQPAREQSLDAGEEGLEDADLEPSAGQENVDDEENTEDPSRDGGSRKKGWSDVLTNLWAKSNGEETVYQEWPSALRQEIRRLCMESSQDDDKVHRVAVQATSKNAKKGVCYMTAHLDSRGVGHASAKAASKACGVCRQKKRPCIKLRPKGVGFLMMPLDSKMTSLDEISHWIAGD
ncbi:hypothetical protein BC567DRAFT_208687 [Phyllosticta citribraziliensis]